MIKASAPRGRGGSPDKNLKIKGARDYKNLWKNLLKEAFEDKEDWEKAKELLITFSVSNIFHVFDLHKVGEEGGRKKSVPLKRVIAQSGRTVNRIFKKALKEGYAVLYRGMFYIGGEVLEEYRKRYKEIKEKPSLSFEVLNLKRLTKIGDSILMDLDDVDEEKVKKLVKYLHRLGIYPEVWKSASGKGYHLYIHLVWRIEVIRKKTVKNGEVIYVGEEKRYELPYASDWRIKAVIEALKITCDKLGVKYDFISAEKAVWFEGLPNPLKDWKYSEKVFDGAIHRLDKLYEKVRPVLEREERKKVVERFKKEYIEGRRRNKVEDKGVIRIEGTECSNPADYIQINLKNGTITRLLNAGYDLDDIHEILAKNYEGDAKAFERAWRGAVLYIYETYAEPVRNTRRGNRERKHKHYWEYISKIRACLKQGITSINGISKAVGIPKSTLSRIFKLVSREQILENPLEVKEYLRSIQKGGVRTTKEKLKEGGKKRFEKYLERELRKIEEKFKNKERKQGKKVKRKEGIRDYFVKLDTRLLPSWAWEISKVVQNQGGSHRANIYYSGTKSQIGRVVDGKGVSSESFVFEKNEEIGIFRESESVFNNKKDVLAGRRRPRGGGEKKKLVKFYDLEYEEKKVKQIAPMIKERTLQAHTWWLFIAITEELFEKNVRVVLSEDHIKKENDLPSQKLLKLVRFLYAQKFKKWDFSKYPIIEEVLKLPGIKRLDLGGWGRFARPLMEVLREFKLIDEDTEVILPNKTFELPSLKPEEFPFVRVNGRLCWIDQLEEWDRLRQEEDYPEENDDEEIPF